MNSAPSLLCQAIQTLLQQRGSNMAVLARHVALSRSGLIRALDNETLQAKHLKKICLFLEVSADELLGISPIKPLKIAKQVQELKRDIALINNHLQSNS